jgi:hypothetical protein
MTHHLRPTAPPPLPEPGYALVAIATADQVLGPAGYDGLGVYCAIVAAQQAQTPCTPEHLAQASPLDAAILPRVLRTLVGHGFVAWGEEGDAA